MHYFLYLTKQFTVHNPPEVEELSKAAKSDTKEHKLYEVEVKLPLCFN
jgi:hypothetical protein